MGGREQSPWGLPQPPYSQKHPQPPWAGQAGPPPSAHGALGETEAGVCSANNLLSVLSMLPCGRSSRVGLTQGSVAPNGKALASALPAVTSEQTASLCLKKARRGSVGPQEAAAWGGTVPVCTPSLSLPVTGAGTTPSGRGGRQPGPGTASLLRRTQVGGPSWAPGEPHFRGTGWSRRLPGRGGRWKPAWCGSAGTTQGGHWAAVVRHHLPVQAGGAGARQSPGPAGDAAGVQRGRRESARTPMWRAVGAVAASVCPHGRPASCPPAHLSPGTPRPPFASRQRGLSLLLTDVAAPAASREIGEVILGRAETSVRSATPPQPATCPLRETWHPTHDRQ